MYLTPNSKRVSQRRFKRRGFKPVPDFLQAPRYNPGAVCGQGDPHFAEEDPYAKWWRWYECRSPEDLTQDLCEPFLLYNPWRDKVVSAFA